MLDDLYTRIDFLRKGLEGLWTRNQVISDNVANVDTNGYKAKNVNFEQVFKRYLDKEESDIYRGKEYEDYKNNFLNESRFSIYDRKGLPVKANENNVDVDIEMTYLAENTMKYNLVKESMDLQINLLKDVINEGKR